MPKVLRILNRFNLGGPTYNAAYLTKYLEPDFETLLIGGDKDESEGSSLHITESLDLKPRVIKNLRRSVNPIKDRASYQEVRNIIREFKPDIVHTHASKAGFVGRLAAIHENVPHILHTFHGHVFHGYFNPLKTAVFKTIERELAKRSDRIIAISDIQKRELAEEHKICPSDKIEVIPLGFDLDRFQTDTEKNRKKFRNHYLLSDEKLAIGIIGRLVPIKNHHLFLQAIHKLKANGNQPFQAFIIGDGESRNEIEGHCNELGLTLDQKPNAYVDVIFTSWIKEIDHTLPGLDLIALTSLNEGTPVSLIEAQAAEKAIVSTNVGGIQNVVLPNRSALLSEIGDNKSFIHNLITLATDNKMRNDFSLSGKDFVFEHFHYNRLVNDMSKLYSQLLEQ